MKNKALISFCINILVALLFCFPVFSAEVLSKISAKEVNVSCNELCINKIADSKDKLKKDFPKSFKPLKGSVKYYNPFNNSFPAHASLPVRHFYHLYSDLTFPFKKFLFPDFADLSYLRELKVTKMLC